MSEAKRDESELSALLAGAGFATAADVQDKVRLLANGTWTRYWFHYGSRDDGTYIMAIQCIAGEGTPLEIAGIEHEGFVKGPRNTYFINRAKEDGTPFKGVFSS
jgi:hypothetical protein